ncbi:MAG TPA: DUF4129 domain-containing protein [Chloroflexi bacterium]|nr:DUF4129 domain-containing protein [Chloroflexota bacterium]
MSPKATPPPNGTALFFRPLVISGMVACITSGWVTVLERFLPFWQGGYLVLLTGLVTLETLVVDQRLRARHVRRSLPARLAEAAVLLLLLKPATYLRRGWAALGRDARRWLAQPATFLDAEYVIGALVLLTMWLLAVEIAVHLRALEDPYGLPQDRAWGIAALKDRFVMGAVVLLMAVGLQRLEVGGTGLALRPTSVSGLVLHPMLYVGLGLLLFGQARLAILRAGWERNEVPVAPELGRRWAGWGVLFVLGVSALALLLPAGNTALGLYLFAWLALLATLVAQVVLFLLFALLFLLLAPCLALFRVPGGQGLRPPRLPTPPPPPAEATGGPPWLLYLRLTLFWVIVAVALFLVLRTYWRERRLAGGWRLWEVLLGWWRALRAWLGRWRRGVTLRRRGPVEGEEPTPSPSRRTWWSRWRARTARERVRRLYLALLRRAAQAGHPRRPAETPYEYAAGLAPYLADEEEALAALTRAFVEARYSRREFRAEEVRRLRRLWRRLRAALIRSL